MLDTILVIVNSIAIGMTIASVTSLIGDYTNDKNKKNQKSVKRFKIRRGIKTSKSTKSEYSIVHASIVKLNEKNHEFTTNNFEQILQNATIDNKKAKKILQKMNKDDIDMIKDLCIRELLTNHNEVVSSHIQNDKKASQP